jgi:PAS domain S-box
VIDSIRVLYLYDADDPVAPTPAELTRAADIVVETAHSVSEALDRLTAAVFDCVLSTYQLAEGNGVALLRRIREFDSEIPVVLHPHRGTERVASEAISAGVTDYIENDPDSDQGEQLATRLVDAVDEPRHDSGSRIRELTEATDDVLWLVSSGWETVLFVNSAYSSVWGQPETAFRADPTAFLDAVHPEDRPQAERAVDRLTDGESVELELRVDPTEEFERRVLFQAEPILGPAGSVARIAGASREVTEQRAKQRRLRRQQQTVNSIFNALPDVLYTFDTQGYLLRWNERLEAETGYTSSEIEEMYITDFVPAEEVAPITESFQEIIENRNSVTLESAFETKSGERVPFEFTGGPLETADGDLRGFTGIGRNISDRKKRQRRFEAVFDNTYQFTGLMSSDGTLLEVNKTAVEFAGLDRGELVGTKIWDTYFFQTNESARQSARQAVETARDGELFREQITVQGANREAAIDFSVRPVVGEDGRVELLIPEGRDISRLSQRERQLEVTNRFLRHNIRNKLTTIQGYGTLVSEADDEQMRSYGTQITGAATEVEETAEMARNIHKLIKRNPSPATVDLADRLDRAVALVRDRYPTADITAHTPNSPDVTSLVSLDEALAELLATVLENAASAHLSLSVAGTDGDTAAVTIQTTDGAVPPVEREVLTGEIDIDQTKHAQGLGVWYVYWHVWYSGGRIEITGDGDCIHVHLPLA